MSYFDQARFDIRCEWGLPGIEQIAHSDVIIVVDVLSFTTSVDIAISRGAIIYPYRWNDETAIAYARDRGAEAASCRSRFDGRFSLAPSSLENVPAGLRLVLPSPNGSSLAFWAMSTGAVVAAGCLRNASAVARWAQAVGRSITVVPAGEQWPDGSLRPALEDFLGAGAILANLEGRRSPEAYLAAVAFEGVADHLQDQVFSCSSGRELVERGFGRDVELGAELDASVSVPVLKDEAFVGLSPAEPATADFG